MITLILFLIVVGVVVATSVKNLPPHERGVIFRLGKPLPSTVGPGLVLMMPAVDRMVRITVAEQKVDVPGYSIVFRVRDPVRAVTAVSDYRQAIADLARKLIDSHAEHVQSQLSDAAEAWGVQIQSVKVNRFAGASSR